MSKICNAEALALVDSDYFEGYVVPEYCEHLCPDPPPNGASYICSDLDVSTSQTAPYADAAEEGDCYHSSSSSTCSASASGHYRFCPCDDQARRPPRPAARRTPSRRQPRRRTQTHWVLGEDGDTCTDACSAVGYTCQSSAWSSTATPRPRAPGLFETNVESTAGQAQAGSGYTGVCDNLVSNSANVRRARRGAARRAAEGGGEGRAAAAREEASVEIVVDGGAEETAPAAAEAEAGLL